ncbi:hypothetical protein [Sunxiuqinia elliptica]|uniref:Lipocalin-like domain-containing protein n=1 Tax=Sunxiuqinia elliptica TaxID=655355 RepID=A0A4R6H9B1_9BACT|nr:hypothetical protein [Sunxiuqinia elliptica]TDO04674.1 hypothetical protein DET52_10122 [Sunxiuqinia elliptica]TDO64222.1 hypothetical protein DET65_0578 [Sunxiuqinia elliptica]
MKRNIGLLILLTVLFSCNTATQKAQQPEKPEKPIKQPIEGTWKLLSGTLIEKGDTVTTDYTKGVEFIKIINGTHFSFLQHDLTQGKDSAAVFGAGGGTYTLKDGVYTENLDYCSAREWEGNSFEFEVQVDGDTLIQQGVEKIEEQGIDRMNIERYIRVKN